MNNKGNKSNTRHRILDYIKNSDAVRSVDIDAHFDINRQMAHCHLKALIESSKIKKIGVALKTFYTAINEDIAVINYQLDSALYTVISTKTKLNYPLTNILLMQHPDLRPIMITIY
jgi:predicted transcriptional regulator